MKRAYRDSALIVMLVGSCVALLGCSGGALGSDGLGGSHSGVDLGGPDARFGDGSGGAADDGSGNDAQDPGAAGQDEGGAGGGSICQTCIDQRCAAQYLACTDVAECTALHQCGQACADDACFQQCEQSHPTGTDPLFAFYDCLDTSCATECGSDGGDAGGGDPGGGDPGGGDPGGGDPGGGAADACQTCGDAACGGQWQACEGDADCTALLGCYDACGEDESCWYDCEDQHMSGADVYFTFLDCLYASCSNECGG